MRAWSKILASTPAEGRVLFTHCQRPESLALALLISNSPEKKTKTIKLPTEKYVLNRYLELELGLELELELGLEPGLELATFKSQPDTIRDENQMHQGSDALQFGRITSLNFFEV